MPKHIVVVTTVGSEETAVEIARTLVGERLVACVNIVRNVRSVYRWKETIEDEPECVLLMKTREDRYHDLAARVGAIHPYDVPELIVLPIERGSAAYLGWIDGNVTSASGDNG